VAEAKEVNVNKKAIKFNNYKINTTESRVTFTGTKPTGAHRGYFNLQGGSISMIKNTIKGGNFSIDIPSLTIVDAMPVKMANNLKGHLLGDDFFKSEQFPVSTFNIISVTPIEDKSNIKFPGATHNIQGNLRLIDKTKSISFPAEIKVNGDTINAAADFNINRSDFGMVYGNDESLGDKFINPVVNLQIKIVATK